MTDQANSVNCDAELKPEKSPSEREVKFIGGIIHPQAVLLTQLQELSGVPVKWGCSDRGSASPGPAQHQDTWQHLLHHHSGHQGSLVSQS